MRTVNEDKNILRWGGLAGILGSLILIIVFGIVIMFVGANPTEPEGFLLRFPSVRAARTVENALYMLALVLWVPHYLALHRALRKSSPAAALFGSVLAILGLTLLMAGAIPHIVTSRLSDLYYAPGITPAEQATLALMWQAEISTIEMLLIEGLILIPIAFTTLGFGMLTAPNFGKGYGLMSILIGVAGSIAAIFLMIDPRSPLPVIGVFGLIIFHLVLGWKTYALSRRV